MVFNLEQFKGAINQKEGLMRTNKFAVQFSVPQILLGRLSDFRDIQLFTDAVTHPGFLLATHDVRRWSYGPIEKRPWSPQFTQLQCTFYNTNDNFAWRLFDDWTQSIIGHDAANGINDAQGDGLVYELNYKATYATDIQITIFDDNGKIKKQIMCKEAFPSQIPDVNLAWGENNTVFKFQVIFDYLDWFVLT